MLCFAQVEILNPPFRVRKLACRCGHLCSASTWLTFSLVIAGVVEHPRFEAAMIWHIPWLCVFKADYVTTTRLWVSHHDGVSHFNGCLHRPSQRLWSIFWQSPLQYKSCCVLCFLRTEFWRLEQVILFYFWVLFLKFPSRFFFKCQKSNISFWNFSFSDKM